MVYRMLTEKFHWGCFYNTNGHERVEPPNIWGKKVNGCLPFWVQPLLDDESGGACTFLFCHQFQVEARLLNRIIRVEVNKDDITG